MVLNIAQDVVYAVSAGRKLTPKHIGLGLAIHKASRSKELVELVNIAGHCISYTTLQRVEATLAEDQLSRFEQNGNVVVPPNLVRERFTQYAADNIDVLEDTLDGTESFHATQIAAFQRGPASNETQHELPVGRKRTVDNVPHAFHERARAPQSNKKPKPIFCSTIPEGEFHLNSACKLNQESNTYAWLVARACTNDTLNIPAWSGFQELILSSNETMSITGFMPLINAPAHELDTIWEVFRRCKQVSFVLGLQHTVITFDKALYCKAKELVWLRPDECRDIVLRLGSFHLIMNFLRAIGQYIEGSGIREVWTESLVYDEVTAENILQAKHYNRCLRAHKLTFEALWRVLWVQVEAWASENGYDIHIIREKANNLQKACKDNVHESIVSCTEELLQVTDIIPEALKLFDGTHLQHPCYLFWRHYMKMAMIVLNAIYAERTGNWDLHLACVGDMLPFLAVFDHTNYFRWGCVYLADMLELPVTAAQVHREFTLGNFVVKTSCNKFSQLPVDQALEHINKIGKTKGGLVGITRLANARDKWCLTFNDKANLVESTRLMDEMHKTDREHDRKDLQKTRIQRDEEDVCKLVVQLQKSNVFNNSEDLLSLVNNDIASEAIKTSLLSVESKGSDLVREFVLKRLFSLSFFDRLTRCKILTFASMFKVKLKVDPSSIVKADRDLFRRLLVAADAGRDIKLREVLQYELSPILLSLANTDNSLRDSQKADIIPVIESETEVVSVLPDSDLTTCTVIDGMGVVRAIN